MIDQLHPDIVSLDMHMPIMSGLEVLRELHDSPRSTVAVMVTAASEKETVRQAFELGAIGYVTKPFNEERILSVFSHVATIIERRRIGANRLEEAISTAKRAVIVDDSESERSQLKLILENGGYTVVAQVEGGMAGLIAVEKERPDFVCHAVDLSEIDGLNVLACLHAVHPALPVIIVSSHNDSATITRALSGGVKGYIIKPFDPEKVLSAVRHLFPLTGAGSTRTPHG